MTDEPCPFCAIAYDGAPATFVRLWPHAFAIVPLDPVVLGHTLVIPDRHVTDFADNPAITGMTAQCAAELCRDLDLEDANLLTSKGKIATQSVFHLHWHLVPRRRDDRVALPWHSGKHTRSNA